MSIKEKFQEYFDHTGQLLYFEGMREEEFASIARRIFEAGHVSASNEAQGIPTPDTTQESFQFIIGEDSDGNDIWHNLAVEPFYFGSAYKGIESDYPNGIWSKYDRFSVENREISVTLYGNRFDIVNEDDGYTTLYKDGSWKISLEGEYLVVEEFILRM